jgi:hypothetical protein
MSLFASTITKLITTVLLIVLTIPSFGIKASAFYYTPFTQPACSSDIVEKLVSRILYSGYSNCDYFNSSCNTNTNVGKIVNVYGDQNTTTTNNVTITVSGKISTVCNTNPIKVFVNVTDQFGNSLINNDSQYINVNPNCNFNTFYNDCTNFTIQIQAQKSDFINKTLRVEMSFTPKNNYNFNYNYNYTGNSYIPFENSNIFLLEYFAFNNNYDCRTFNTCFTDYPIYTVPFVGSRDFEITTPFIPLNCQFGSIDYYYDSCYYI